MVQELRSDFPDSNGYILIQVTKFFKPVFSLVIWQNKNAVFMELLGGYGKYKVDSTVPVL